MSHQKEIKVNPLVLPAIAADRQTCMITLSSLSLYQSNQYSIRANCCYLQLRPIHDKDRVFPSPYILEIFEPGHMQLLLAQVAVLGTSFIPRQKAYKPSQDELFPISQGKNSLLGM
jgi:hypothetical protein